MICTQLCYPRTSKMSKGDIKEEKQDKQPIPLLHMASKKEGESTKFYATGITAEAEKQLTSLPSPLHIISFVGLGRSGKSHTATKMRTAMAGNAHHIFPSQPGNIPCTHGIDMLVFPNPAGSGSIVFLDCEGWMNII